MVFPVHDIILDYLTPFINNHCQYSRVGLKIRLYVAKRNQCIEIKLHLQKPFRVKIISM